MGDLKASLLASIVFICVGCSSAHPLEDRASGASARTTQDAALSNGKAVQFELLAELRNGLNGYHQVVVKTRFRGEGLVKNVRYSEKLTLLTFQNRKINSLEKSPRLTETGYLECVFFISLPPEFPNGRYLLRVDLMREGRKVGETEGEFAIPSADERH